MEKKRFKKQELKSDDYKVMEQGARATKGLLGIGVAAVAIIKNKDNLKSLGQFAAKIILRK